jgi:hypothetical protein
MNSQKASFLSVFSLENSGLTRLFTAPFKTTPTRYLAGFPEMIYHRARNFYSKIPKLGEPERPAEK